MIKKEPFSLRVNDSHEFNFLPDEANSLDVISPGEDVFHVLKDGKSQLVELVEVDYPSRTYVFRINGNRYEAKISDHYQRLIQELGLSVGGSQKMNAVKAPMPGLVLDVLVQPGQTVQKGDPLLILEAMKMENVIKAAGEGKVKNVKAEKGKAVDKGQLLLEME